MKKILSILLVCMFVLSMPLCVHAEDDVDSIEYSYYMNVLTCDSYNSSMDLGRGHDAYGNFSLIDKQLCLYKGNSTDSVYLYTYVFNDEGIIHHENTHLFGNVFSYFSSCTGSSKYLEYYYHKEAETYSIYKLKGEYANFSCELVWKNPTIEEFGYIHTNIPIFESQEQALKYINGEIGVETALNYSSDLLTTVTDSDEVPLPKNLRIEYDSTNYNYYLMWEYEPKDLEKLTVIAVTGIDKDLFTSPKNLDNYMRYPVDIEFDVSLDEYLEPRLSYKLDITNDVVRLRRTIDEENDFSLADYRVTLDYWVIGSWQKNSTEFHTSKISHVELILDSSDKGFKIDTDNYITDKDMNILDDVEFDTSIDFDTNYSSSGFMGNLVGAFGLLGNNGFLACCKAVFGCFPAFVWDLIGAGLSAAIIIVLIKILFS